MALRFIKNKMSERLDPTQIGDAAEALKYALKGKIAGQEEAIEQIVSLYQAHIAGLAPPGRPLGSALFLGRSGSGKTSLVEALCETLLGSRRALIKIDCAEFINSHEVAKLIGSPPGYLGHRETTPRITQAKLLAQHTDTCKVSFVLFDEIEKAHEAFWNMLLAVLDKATLVLGDNTTVDFTSTFVFMTSNCGVREMNVLTDTNFGFARPQLDTCELAGLQKKTGLEAVRKKFSPEFRKRTASTV